MIQTKLCHEFSPNYCQTCAETVQNIRTKEANNKKRAAEKYTKHIEKMRKCIKHVLEMEAKRTLFRQRLRIWKTVIRLRRLQLIEGQAVQETVEKQRKTDS